MIFFDENNPNKYKKLKKLLVPKKTEITPKKVKVGSGDGGYVLDPSRVDTVLSYGIGENKEAMSFEIEMLKMGCKVHMYDGALEQLPIKNPEKKGGDPKFFSENLDADNFKKHVNRLQIKSRNTAVLKMDIEGHEYSWLTSDNLKILSDNFGQFCIEVHSLIEETPQGWVLEPQLKEAKENKQKVLSFFQKLNDKFTLTHIHGNNHSPRYVDLPDCLELTYVNNDVIGVGGIDYSRFPVDGLDEPNYNMREDYVLDWW